MNILYVAHRLPFPPDKGDKIRSYHEIKFLSKTHHIDLICLNDEKNKKDDIESLKKICNKLYVFSYHKLRGRLNGILHMLKGKPISVGNFYFICVQKKIEEWLQENVYDAVICFSTSMAEYIFSISPNKKIKNIKLIMDLCDVDSDKWRQYSIISKYPMKFVYLIEHKLLKKYETQVLNYFDYSIFISEYERSLILDNKKYINKIKIIKNGVDHEIFKRNKIKSYLELNICKKDHYFFRKSSKKIIFVGAMDYKANVDGVLWFCKKILPIIRYSIPDVLFYIVGSNPVGQIKALDKDPNICVTGYVNDVRNYYDNADVCVVPLRIARGLQNKVLEALSMKLPTVATSKSANAIEAENNKHLFICDDKKVFADSVIKLLNDKELSKRFCQNARKFVIEKYSWETNMTGLNKILLSKL